MTVGSCERNKSQCMGKIIAWLQPVNLAVYTQKKIYHDGLEGGCLRVGRFVIMPTDPVVSSVNHAPLPVD